MPFIGDDLKELEQKICEKKYAQLPNNINKTLQGLIRKCLSKKPEARPTIDQIILDPDFQAKCKFNKI